MNMKRRQFLGQSARAAMAIPFLNLPGFMKAARMGIVVHSYAARWGSQTASEKYPGFRDAIDLMEHCHSIGAGGIQVGVRDWSADFARKARESREKLGMFLEGSVALPKGRGDIARFDKDIAAAKEAGAIIVRTVCLNGRRYETFASQEAFAEFAKNSVASLELAEPVMQKHRIRLAVENHKDWRAPELAEIMRKLASEWVGVTLDFGNNLALIEDPMEVVNAIAPYALTTHVKDMGVSEYEEGFLLSEVPLGEGVLDLKSIFEICRRHRADVSFNLEMITRDPLKIPCLQQAFWQTLPSAKPGELARTLRMVKQNPFGRPLPVVSPLDTEGRLAAEEQNIVASLRYSQTDLGMG
jgi:sugar phosphate isomerase/epimerase